MKEIGVKPAVQEMQKLKLFDGAEFDARDPEKYARSFAVHNMG